MLHTPIENTELARIESATPRQILDLFEAALKSRSRTVGYGNLPVAWGVLFSSMYLSNMELEREMQEGICRLSEDQECTLREFINADCEHGGTFVLNVIKTGGMIDRSALIMVADLKKLAGLNHEGTTAIHMLTKACTSGGRPTLIRKAGKKLLGSVFDHTGLPVLFSILSMHNLGEEDLVAIESAFTKEDLRNVMSQSRMGRNGLEAYTEISTTVRENIGVKRKPDIVSTSEKIPDERGTGQIPAEPSIPIHTVVKNYGKPEKIADIPQHPPMPEPVVSGTAGVADTPGREISRFSFIPPSPDQSTFLFDSHDNFDTSMKVMIVDDDEIIRGLLRLQLKRLGYNTFIMAESGDDAVKLASETKPDIVFMDINMPGAMDGIAAAGLIKTQRNSRIIFLTAMSDDDVLVRAREIHPEGYILKPFTDTDLRVTLNLLG